MTTPDPRSPSPQPPVPAVKDRVYRSPSGIAGGVLLLALALWLGVDALVTGEGRTPWTAAAVLLLLVPLVIAYTVRPAVFADEDRLRVRNPFRVVVLPWGQVARFRSAYSNEVFTEGDTKYQLWAVPVSLRGRKKAARQETRRAAGGSPGRGRAPGGFGQFGARDGADAVEADGPVRAEADKVMDEVRDLWEQRKEAVTSQGEVTVRWAYEILVPAAVGLVAAVVLLAAG